MSEETGKFKVYVSYLKDEAPPELVEELITGLRAITGVDDVLESNLALSSKELYTRILDCQVLVHIITASSYYTRQTRLEVLRAFYEKHVIVTYIPEPASIPIELDSTQRSLPDILLLVAGLANQSKQGNAFAALAALRVQKDSFSKARIDQALGELKAEQARKVEEHRQQSLFRLEQLTQEWFTSLERQRLDEASEIFEQAQLIWKDQPSEELHERFVILRAEARSLLKALYEFEALQGQGEFEKADNPLRHAFNISSRLGLTYLQGIIGERLHENQHRAWQLRYARKIYAEARRLIQAGQFEAGLQKLRSIESSAISLLGGRSVLRFLEYIEQMSLIEQELRAIRHEMALSLDSVALHRLRVAETNIISRLQSLVDSGYVAAVDLSASAHPLPSSTQKKSTVFTLYNPRQVQKCKRYSLLVYAHDLEEQRAVKEDARKFSDELGDAPKERHSAEAIPLTPKTEITIVPEAEGITFDPPELTKTWDEKWLRFNFDFEVPDTYKHEEIPLHISVQVKGFEVACIKSSCEVVAETVAEAARVLPDDPLVDPPHDSGTRKADAYLYRNVFLSYSRKDEEIAWRRVREIESMLGDRVFMDLKDLRAGEDWESRLFEAIDQADILHLLWSENSAASKACREEWMYALKKKCGDTRCFGVIRPVYWHEPMPAPPDELKHLHFQRIKLEDA